MFRLFIGFGLLSLVGCQSATKIESVQADVGSAESTEVEEAKADGSNVYTCRLERVVGSNMRQRVCVSRADAEEMREAGREKVRAWDENSGRTTGNE